MKIATSYFYQIRFFKPNMIPISTAMWDPKWFHNYKGNNYYYQDRNGVVNGLRIHPLVPGAACADLCRGIDVCATKDPKTCAFLQNYRKQLDAIDFPEFMVQLSSHIAAVCKLYNIKEEPIVVFIVYEVPSKMCSERVPLLQWFNDNGIPVQELKYPIADNY